MQPWKQKMVMKKMIQGVCLEAQNGNKITLCFIHVPLFYTILHASFKPRKDYPKLWQVTLFFVLKHKMEKIKEKKKQSVRKKRTPNKEETKFDVFLECKNKHETTQVMVSHTYRKKTNACSVIQRDLWLRLEEI